MCLWKNRHSFEELQQGACIGTSSLRRAVQLHRARPDGRL
ncbi:MAG: hypothetical protein H8D81_00800 [Deltaproteobacteria bacterium]|nr:hypothetical protein [Deltaproteobacteria bacterium]